MNISYHLKLYVLTVPVFFFIDILWGTCLCLLVAGLGFLIAKWRL